MKDYNYYTISGWMINQLNLKGNTLNVYAIIFGFCQNNETEFDGSRQYIAGMINSSKPTVDKAINELLEKDLIIKNQRTINGVIFNSFRINFDKIKNFTSGKETLLGDKEILSKGGKETLHNNNNINIYKYIIDYLNNKCKKNFRYEITKTKTLIQSRLNEGFTVDDFKKVIDIKYDQWFNDEKMNQYLRPETLFGTKFESYLNTGKAKKEINEGELI